VLRKILAFVGLPLLVVVAFYASNWLLGHAVSGFFSIFDVDFLRNNEILTNLIIHTLSFVFILIILSLFPLKAILGNEVKDVAEDPSRKKDIVLHVILGVAGFVVYFLISMVLISLFNNFEWFYVQQEQELGVYASAYGTVQLVLAAIAFIIVAPYFEEAIFRGWLYGNMRKARVNGIAAALAVSVVFGFLHGQWNVAVDTFALSLVACYLYEQTNSIRPAVLLHMIKNAIAFYLIFLVG
jgi:membrane protease YdiL (CAAX protease family)